MLNIKRNPDWGILFLRLGVGFVFLMHGIGKLFGIGPFAAGVQGVSGFLSSIGVPASTFFAWIVAIGEPLAGLLLILGAFTSLAALYLILQMIIALALVHLPGGFYETAGELPLLLLLGALAILLLGPGKIALQKSK